MKNRGLYQWTLCTWVVSHMWHSVSFALPIDEHAELYIDRSNVLQEWSQDGLDFNKQFVTKAKSTLELFQISKSYRDLVQTIEADLAEQVREVESRKNEFSNEFPAKTFQSSWLKSSNSRFELVAIVNRPDRRFVGETPCGEIRLVYRLSYRIGQSETWFRLPATVMLVYGAHQVMGSRDCKVIAERMNFNISRPDIYQPYIQAMFSPKKPLFHHLEVNIQSSKWPSSWDKSFSQQTHYLLRVFKLDEDGSRLLEEPLENTPDVKKIKNDPDLREKFVHWLSQKRQLDDIDQGTMLLPKIFLATKAVSVSPFGSVRLANQPFSALLQPSKKMTSERLHHLDTFSCNGCHQSQSIAGFHALGQEWNSDTKDLTLMNPFSAHFLGVQEWRKSDWKSLLVGATLSRQPIADRIQGGGQGDTCSSKFPNYGCKKGFVCDTKHNMSSSKDLGQCIVSSPVVIGSACDPSHLLSDISPLQDRVFDEALETTTCDSPYQCDSSRNGFPGGYCVRTCFSSTGSSLCVPIPTLNDFSTCVAKTGLFRECVKKHSIRTTMQRCKSHMDCRTDYACINTDSNDGYCGPPYFLPDLTIDHHPTH